MTWALIAAALVGVVGLLYGLLERSKRQVAEGKADTFSKQLVQAQADHQDSVLRYENLVSNMRNEILKLQKDLNANVPTSALAERINDVLGWRVRPPEPTPNPAGSGVSKDPAPGNAESPG